MTVSVSVICPVRNRKHLIGETLESLHRQTFAATEIIVVDDASEDGTAEEVAARWPSVRLLRCDRNNGPGAARNRGLAAATGDFVIFFDSDDLATDDYLAARVETAIREQAELVYGPWLPAWLENGTCGHDGYVRQSGAPPAPPLEAFLRGWILLLQACLLRRDLVMRVGGYPEHLWTGEDMLLLFRILTCAPRAAQTPRSLLLLRQHPAGQISARPEGEAQRALDDLMLCDAVARELSASRIGRERAKLRRAWSLRRAISQQRARQYGLDIAASEDDFLILAEARLASFSRRLRLAATARLLGHRIDRAFSPAPLSSSDIAAIERLGYVARRLDQGAF